MNEIIKHQQNKVVNPIFWVILMLILVFSSCSKEPMSITEEITEHYELDVYTIIHEVNTNQIVSDLIHCTYQLEVGEEYAIRYPFRFLRINQFLDECMIDVQLETGKCTGRYVRDTIPEILVIKTW